MLNNLRHDAEFQNVTDISAEWLTQHCIRGLALDMDNTVARYSEAEPAPDVVAWLNELRDSGISAVVVSNSHKPDRVSRVCAALGIDYIHKAAKPSKKGFTWAAKHMGMSPENVAAVGDQLFTDVLGANRAGCKTILVYPRGMDENILFRVRYSIETPFRRSKNV